MIPKTIHYCWFGGKEKNPKFNDCLRSWKKYLPDYEIVEWNETNFDIYQNQYIKEAYDNKKYAFVSDYARLYIVEKNGGIYLDTDVELIKRPPESFLQYGYISTEHENLVNTGLGFCCEKNNPIIKKMLDDYNNIHFIDQNGKMDTTPCPIRNSNSINDFIKKTNKIYKIKNLYVLPQEYCNPLDYQTGIMTITKNTISIHHGEASWLDKTDKKLLEYKHKCIQKYGKTKGERIYLTRKFLVYFFKKPKELCKIIKRNKK